MISLMMLTLLYGCSSENDDHAIPKKPVEPLTVSGAMNWYNETVGMLEKQKSTTDSSAEVPYQPLENLAKLFADELWYAVESPLDFGDQSLMIMTPEVSDYTVTHGDDAIKQTLKLVVLRNKETGETYSFIMAVVPELNYMLRKGDELNKITYLSRDSDFDGYIFFFTLDGHLINGWLYEDGKVTGGTNLSGDGKRTKIAKAMYMEIKVCGSYMVECGGGSGGGVDCYTYIEVVYIEDGIGNPSSGGGGNIQYPNSGGGTNTDSWVPIKPTPSGKEKKPGERTDCTEQAAANAKNAKDAITGSSDIVSKINTLKEAARNKPNEYGMVIDSKGGGFQAEKIIGGTDEYITYNVNEYTVYDVHTHNKTDGFSGHSGYTGFSVRDISVTMYANKVFYDHFHGSAPYKGGIVIAYDGSEYVLSVNDAKKARNFYTNNPAKFEADDEEMFNDSGMSKEYDNIYENLLNKGFSYQDSHDYALTYLLDKYDTGLKISKKEDGEAEFKEMKTEFRNAKISYQPKKCP